MQEREETIKQTKGNFKRKRNKNIQQLLNLSLLYELEAEIDNLPDSNYCVPKKIKKHHSKKNKRWQK